MTIGPMRASAAATLGLASLLLQVGRGSSSNQGQASAGITLERVQERFARHPAHLQKASNGNTAERFIDVGKLTINGTTSIEGLGIDIKNLPAGKGDSDKSTENGDGNGGSRQLQTSCASSSSVDVASSVFPLMEGCHSASTDTSGNEIIYFSTTSLVVALPLSDDADAEFYWLAMYLNSADEFVSACLALEIASTVHPVDGTWYCDLNGDGDLSLPTSTQFSATCGCSGDDTDPAPTPVAAVTPAPVPPTAPSPTPDTGGTCIAGDSFLVSSSVWPDIEGCYRETGFVLEDEIVYTMTGTTDLGQTWMFAYTPQSSPSTTLWALAFATESTSSSEFFNHCYSNELATSYHPADVISWWCDETESGSYTVASSSTFSVGCGCTETTPTPVTATPDPGSLPTPAPMQGTRVTSSPAPTLGGSGSKTPSPSRTVTDTPGSVTGDCEESDEFSITSSQAPVLEECYQPAGGASNFDGQAYSVTGTLASEQVMVAQIDIDGDTVWFIAFVSDDEDQFVLYCTSLEDSTIVHPTDATWGCDLDGDSEVNLVTVTDSDLSVDCGCDGAPSPVPPSPTSPDEPTAVNQPTVGGSTNGIAPKRYVSFALTAGAGALVVATLVMKW